MNKIKYRIPFYAALLLYAMSFMMTFFTSGNIEMSGLFMFFTGWLFLLNDISAFVAWLANITFFMSILSVAKRKKKPKKLKGLVLSIISVVFGLMAFSMGKIETDVSSVVMQSSELGFGFYVWLLSFISMMVSMFLRLKAPKEELA